MLIKKSKQKDQIFTNLFFIINKSYVY